MLAQTLILKRCCLPVPRAEHNSPVWFLSASAFWPDRTSLEPVLLTAAGTASFVDATATPATAAGAAAAVYSCLYSAGSGYLGKNAHGGNGNQTAAVI